jgi:hypothetical protein
VHSRQPSTAAVPGISEAGEAGGEPSTNGAGAHGNDGRDAVSNEEAPAVGGAAAASERPMFLEPRWKAAEKVEGGGGSAFTQRELDEAMKRVEQSGPA